MPEGGFLCMETLGNFVPFLPGLSLPVVCAFKNPVKPSWLLTGETVAQGLFGTGPTRLTAHDCWL